tara:strand:+ start:204 stop:599 length:396 start_codon:yes stop_codon:yes gene_type:complete
MADHMEWMFRNQRMDTLEKRIGWYKEQIEQLKAKLEVERMAQRQERWPWQGLDGPIVTMGLDSRMVGTLSRMVYEPGTPPNYEDRVQASVRRLIALDWDDDVRLWPWNVGEKTVAAVKLWMENNKEKCNDV